MRLFMKEGVLKLMQFSLDNLLSWGVTVVGARLSESHTSETALRMCVYTYVRNCLLACIRIP